MRPWAADDGPRPRRAPGPSPAPHLPAAPGGTSSGFSTRQTFSATRRCPSGVGWMPSAWLRRGTPATPSRRKGTKRRAVLLRHLGEHGPEALRIRGAEVRRRLHAGDHEPRRRATAGAPGRGWRGGSRAWPRDPGPAGRRWLPSPPPAPPRAPAAASRCAAARPPTSRRSPPRSPPGSAARPGRSSSGAPPARPAPGRGRNPRSGSCPGRRRAVALSSAAARLEGGPGTAPKEVSRSAAMMPMGVGFLCMLRAESLTKSYLSGGRELTVLHGITFDLEPGGFLAIVGPSGSGKSTLLALLAGLDQPTSGRVVLGGTDLGPLSEDDRARLRSERVGFVFQAFNLIPTLTARENVEVPLELRGEDPGDRALAASRPGGPRGARPPLPGPALGGRAAAGGAGPRLHPPAQAALRRRAHGQPRRRHRSAGHRAHDRAQRGGGHDPRARDPRPRAGGAGPPRDPPAGRPGRGGQGPPPRGPRHRRAAVREVRALRLPHGRRARVGLRSPACRCCCRRWRWEWRRSWPSTRSPTTCSNRCGARRGPCWGPTSRCPRAPPSPRR